MEGKRIYPLFKKGGNLPIMVGQAEVDEVGTISFKTGRGKKVTNYETVFFEDGSISHYEVEFAIRSTTTKADSPVGSSMPPEQEA